MPCFRPRIGWRARNVNRDTGKRSIVFNPREGFRDLEQKVPCGQCIGCRLEDSRQKAIRCVHEASLYEKNCFVTLTYHPDFLPKEGSIDLEAPALWMKRLRKKFGSGIRSFGCAEYGEKYGRPHYHIALFNHDFDDKKVFKRRNGFNLYTSDSLAETWPYGHSAIADLSFESAAYIARYVTKKINADKRDGNRKRFERYHAYSDLLTREVKFLHQPEQGVCVSRRPGIGKPWFDKYSGDIYPDDFVVVRERKMKPPKYYDSLLEKIDPRLSREVKLNRKITAKQFEGDNSDERLAVKEELQLLKFKKLVRSLEDEA